jgi:hypothetical protein
MDRIRIGGVDDDENLTFNPEAWKTIGLDMDSSCTGSASCLLADAPVQDRSCAGDPQFDGTDGEKCRDNTLGFLFPIGTQSNTVGGWFGVTEANWNCALHRGETGQLFRISDYNGTAYDPSVRLDIYTSTGTQILPTWSCVKLPEYTVNPAWPSQPPWLATRHWKVSRRSIALNAPPSGNELPIAKFADPAAFVRGGYIFASLPPGAEMWMNGENSHVRPLRTVLQRAIMVGRLTKTGNTWLLDDATIQGAVFPSDEVQAFREIGYCQNVCGSYDALIEFFNITRDVLSSTADKLPNTPCDALSIGYSLRARSATADINDIVDAEPPLECPQPKNPNAPRQGCTCQTDGSCSFPDGGAPTDAGGG